MREGDSIAAVAKVPAVPNEDEVEGVEGMVNNEESSTTESSQDPEIDNSEV